MPKPFGPLSLWEVSTLKIILSRKGFDSQYGGKPSPIFPDGRALCLPIPTSARSPVDFGDVQYAGRSIGLLVEQLTQGAVSADRRCHLDPDLDATSLPRPDGWKPAFGQVGAAQSHLERQGVGPGDLFLFFAWFRKVEPDPRGGWRYVRGARDVHQLYGWLQIDKILRVGSNVEAARERWPWLAGHPHVNGVWNSSNTIYTATNRLSLAEAPVDLPGGGCFQSDNETLVLTDPKARTRSIWRLPSWFLPNNGTPRLTYHGNPTRWTRGGDWVILKTVAKGQEFVFDIAGSPQAFRWLARLFTGERPDADQL